MKTLRDRIDEAIYGLPDSLDPYEPMRLRNKLDTDEIENDVPDELKPEEFESELESELDKPEPVESELEPTEDADLGIELEPESSEPEIRKPSPKLTAPGPKIEPSESPESGVDEPIPGLESELSSRLDFELGVPIWSKASTIDKKDIAFMRSDGFYLRARKLESVPNRWVAQLHNEKEILDKGIIDIPDGVDAEVFLKKVCDEMLNIGSHRSEDEND